MRTAPPPALQQARKVALSRMADAVSGALEMDRLKAGRRYTDYRDLSKRMGREMNRTLLQILKEGDTTVTTLADLAEVTGCRLEIRFVEKQGPVAR